MTNHTPPGQVPEALRLAEILEGDYCPDWFYEQGVDEVAAELRRLHAENERLAALVEAQQPAPSAAAALPEGWVPLAITHEGQYPEGVAYAKAQAAPAADATTMPEGWTDADADAARLALELECLLTDTKDQAAVSKWWTSANDALELHRARLAAPPQQASVANRLLQLADELDEQLTSGAKWSPAQHACCSVSNALRAMLAEAPQPSPMPQADSQPAPQGETNAQLDIDSNSSAPGQQRDVAGSVALGQPVGNGSDQAAGHTGAQGDKLLIVAERNIRSFLRSAVFKSESDREAALNCVDVLWEAARAPADSVTAPAYSIDADPQGIRARVAEAITGALAFGAQGANPPPTGHWLVPFWETAREEASRNRPVSSDTLYLLRRLLSNQHTLTGAEFREELTKIVGEATQEADSVLEDAARWQMAVLVGNEVMLHPDKRTNPAAVKAYMDAVHSGLDLTGAVDAARKQGANHD